MNQQTTTVGKDSVAPISTEVYVIPLAGHYLVYAPLRRVAFLANAALVNFLWRLRQGQVEEPHDGESALLRFLEDVRLLGEEGDMPIASLGSPTFKPTQATLFLTTRCDLRCIYCYASAGARTHVDMDLSTAKRGIAFVCRNALELGRESFGVSYHGGGEPTVHWKVLVESLAYAREVGRKHDLEVYATAATNGVFSEEKRQWIIENLQGVSLSVDGLPQVQDAQRRLRSGGPSSNIVFRTIEAFEKANFSYGIRMTVTALSVGRLPDGVNYLLDRAHPKRIQVEPVYDLGRGRDTNLHVKPEVFVEAFLEAKRIANAHGVELFYSSARIDVLTNRFCRSCGEGFGLTPKGNVSACYEVCDEEMEFADIFVLGHYDTLLNRYVFDDKRLRRLRDRAVESIPWCQGCFCKWHCAGDCPHKAQHATADGEFVGHPRCEITQALVLHELLRRIGENGGVCWAE